MKNKMYPISREELNKLPQDILEQTLETLKAFDECHITFENGRYHSSTGVCLLAKYPEDFKVIGTVYADDIYTKEERDQNYIESFYDYPAGYTGVRDYKALKEKQIQDIEKRKLGRA